MTSEQQNLLEKSQQSLEAAIDNIVVIAHRNKESVLTT